MRQRPSELSFVDENDRLQARRLQKAAKAGRLLRLVRGVYAPVGSEIETAALVQRNWQKIAGVLIPGAVVSHISALTVGLTASGQVTLSHPTQYNRSIKLPGATLVLLKGPGPLPGDLELGSTGLFWAGRARALLENVGKAAPRRIGRKGVEEHLIDILHASGEAALNDIRDAAKQLAPALDMQSEFEILYKMIGALLGTHSKGELRTHHGVLVTQGTPLDLERQARFERLATCLRTVNLPAIADVASVGLAKTHFAFVESYFSNFVEGTKFDIEQARGIVMRNEIVASRPKDSHDILGVFRLATTSPYRNTLPPTGAEFLEGLQQWHAEMLKNRPEAHPGHLKTQVNFAGTTRFVEPAFVRGTLAQCSTLALSIPEGLARAIFYAFLVSDIHPFDDGNGRLSRLVMNAELSRVGRCRVIIPTLFHPQYVDCAKQLTQLDIPDGFVKAIAMMAAWCSQFDYDDLNTLIADLRRSNALEESLVRFKLLNRDVTAPDPAGLSQDARSG